MRFNLVKDSLSEAWTFLKPNFKPFFLDILKIQLIAALVSVIFLLAGGLIIYYGILENGINLASLFNLSRFLLPLAATTIFIFLGMFLYTSIISILYNVVDARLRNTKLDFGNVFKQNLFPMFKYSLISSIIYLIPLGLLVAISVFFFISYSTALSEVYSARDMIQEIFSPVFLFVVGVIDLFTQFAIFELLISKKGAIASFRNSLNLVRKNFYETIAFSFIMWVVVSVLSQLVLSIPLILLVFAFIAAFALSVASPAAMLIVIAIFSILILGLLLLSMTLGTAILLPAQYLYWKKIAGDEPKWAKRKK